MLAHLPAVATLLAVLVICLLQLLRPKQGYCCIGREAQSQLPNLCGRSGWWPATRLSQDSFSEWTPQVRALSSAIKTVPLLMALQASQQIAESTPIHPRLSTTAHITAPIEIIV